MGDFNVIAKVEEKLGGTPYRLEKSFDFLNFMEDTGVQDAGFVGNIYTWCNNRGAPDTIWKRLDRMLYNSEWFVLFNRTTVTHLAISGSDHAPLLIQFTNTEKVFTKYFKFLNAWTDHPQFLEVMGKIWSFECQGNPMWILHQKLKRTGSLLSTWSKDTYGDIFEVPKRLEQEINNLELALQNNNSPSIRASLSKKKVEYVFYLKTQANILRQKSRVRWLVDGDTNTSYFHKTITDKRRRIGINKIMDEDHEWVEGNEKVAEAGVKYFKGIFSHIPEYNDFQDLECINTTITNEINRDLIELPTEEEIRNNLMTMDSDSAPRHDGFTAKLFQTCWEW
ncbi:uncharacterized protein [Solanum tuberosum]|uniref:uncharacterized protein n=1 Tax=Solanum tuberosum TaxID=4113 RepID=UPI00073A3AB3|nr:PREDICTED: uncharacterized protein LOC107062650 [Solanum tuberosum]